MVFLLLIFKLMLGINVYFAIKLLVSVAVCVFYLLLFFFLFFHFFMCVCSIVTYICIFGIFKVNSLSTLDEPFKLLEQML